jgi:hypothetical protein
MAEKKPDANKTDELDELQRKQADVEQRITPGDLGPLGELEGEFPASPLAPRPVEPEEDIDASGLKILERRQRPSTTQ